MKFPNLGRKKLYYEPVLPIPHRDIQPGKSILSAIKKKDLMLFFPYHPFDHFIDLLREASIDPICNIHPDNTLQACKEFKRNKCLAECCTKRQKCNNCC